MKLYFILPLALFLTSFWVVSQDKQGTASETEQELLQNFITPPNEAKPRVWWHWMNGNITKEGIQKDLEWMERTGIGGFQNFDANLFTPVVVPNKLVFMTPGWKDAFKFTTDLAIEKGLEMAIAGSPGWSVTGGPWVAPKDGMKKYVWSELVVEGGKTFKGKLPEPPKQTSTFQNVAPQTGFNTDPSAKEKPMYYADAAVIAYKLPEGEVSLTELNPKVTSSGGTFLLGDLTDGDLHGSTLLPPAKVGEKTWVQYEFETPRAFKAYSVVSGKIDELAVFRGMPNNRTIEVSDDGKNFRKLVDIPGNIVPQTSGALPETKTKYWRFTYETLPPSPPGMEAMFGVAHDPNPKGTDMAEFVLYNTARIDAFEDKAGFAPYPESSELEKGPASDAIAKENVVDLTDKFRNDGSLNWEVPEGRWKIVRLGYSLTGRENHPASPEATGLEVDKLDAGAVRNYINTYLDMYKDATGGLMGDTGLGYMILDSYEAGHMNWTHNMIEEFKTRRGYDMKPWIPVLTGRIIESREASEKFLWDFRKTIGEMIVDNHYDVIGEELHKRNMKRYTESHENGRVFLADGMDVKRHADVPMSAMWTPGSLAGGADEEVRSEADIREAASVANIYGKPFVAAESMTAVGRPFQDYPENLKRTADLEMASGLNRFVIHTSVHQPLEKGPGFSLGPFGQYFSRLETWSGAGAKAWIDYLARSSYMLQQGQNVADVLYLYGENSNITWICREKLPKIPKGSEFDFVNASILKEDIAVENGHLIAPSGNSYKVLMLDESTKEMTLSVLEKISELQKEGIKVVGTKPESSPSLADDAAEFQKLAQEVGSKMTRIESLGLTPDVTVSGTDHKVLFRHRKVDGQQDIYWLNHRSDEPTSALVSFNVSGKLPKLWNAQTGKVTPVAYEIKEGRTEVALSFESWDAIFIVFEENSTEKSLAISIPEKKSEQVIEGNWGVNFEGKSKEISELKSWTEMEDTKYFSGTATYSKTFKLKKLDKNLMYIVRFSDIKNVAEVYLNGQEVGTIWKKPYSIEITNALIKGENNLELKVTNVWANRLVGDAQPDVKEKTTFTTMPFYQADAPLFPSGIIGKVTLIGMSNK